MILTEKLNFYAQTFQQQNIYQSLDRDSILGGKNSSPFWTEFSQAISTSLWWPTQRDLLAEDLNWLNGYAKSMSANSWFSMKTSSHQNRNSFKICCPSSIASVQGFTDSENTKSKSSKSYKKTSRHGHNKKSIKMPPNSVKKIRVYPEQDLHRLWKQWLAAYRRVYNWALEQLKAGFKGDLQKACRANDNFPDWVFELPGHQKQEACDEAFDAYRQARKNGGEAKFKSCRAKSQTIQFKVGNYKHGTWYPRKTNGLSFKATEPIPLESIYGTELVISVVNGLLVFLNLWKYYLLAVIE